MHDPAVVAPRLTALRCSLVAEGASRPGRCAWCARPLVGRHTTWCSRRHRDAWTVEHVWADARHEALRRAAADGKAVDARCARCGVAEDGWRQCYRADVGRYVRCSDEDCAAAHLIRRHALQVDHIEPRNGRGYDTGCWNHQANLQVLCQPCHTVAGVVRRRVADALARAATPALSAGPRTEQSSLWSSPDCSADATNRPPV